MSMSSFASSFEPQQTKCVLYVPCPFCFLQFCSLTIDGGAEAKMKEIKTTLWHAQHSVEEVPFFAYSHSV